MSKQRTSQLPLDLKTSPQATGDLLNPSKTHPATVPVPLPIVMVRVTGPFTALDRKLWLLLLHNAWDELDSDKPFHEISVGEVLRLFRKFGRTDLGTRGKIRLGKNEEDTEAAELWNSLRRLVQTTVEWEDDEFVGIASLVSGAQLGKRHRESGRIYYTFGKMLAQQILLPRMFARLRCHVILSLRGKYAVTLYEILEAYVNRRVNNFTVSLDDLRSWLKVSEEATSYEDWKYLKRRVIDPAVDEINSHSEDVGFFVSYEGIREGKSFTKLKFIVVPTAERCDRDEVLQSKAKRARSFKRPLPATNGAHYEPTDEVFERMRAIAPGWDRHALLAEYREWCRKKGGAVNNPHGAFLAWVKKKVAGTKQSAHRGIEDV